METLSESTRFLRVDKDQPERQAMVNASERRFVKLAPPTLHSGVGSALRQAFAVSEQRTIKDFEELLARLS